MTTDEMILTDIHRMDAEMETLIGRKVFGHISAPTQTSTRVTFGDGHVCLGISEARDYMLGLLITARQDTDSLPWPLNEPV